MSAARDVVVRRDAAVSLGIDRARLPQLYAAALNALRQCDAVDELKDISDKHDAIALYAKQSKDLTLMHYAQRIKARAFERLGELLKAIEDKDVRDTLAKRHGIALVTARRAVRAAHIPKRVRDTMIEATPVPSITRMAEVGDGYAEPPHPGYFSRFRRHAHAEAEIKHPPERQASELVRYLDNIKVDIDYVLGDNVGGTYTVMQLGQACDPDDAQRARELIPQIYRLLEGFKQALPRAGASA